MAFLKKKIQSSSAVHPATAIVRNYLATSNLYETRYTEYFDGTNYYIRVVLFQRGARPKVQLFCIEKCGSKNATIEECYKGVASFLDAGFTCQGLDEAETTQTNPITMPDENEESSKHENVIITGAEDGEQASDGQAQVMKLREWSCSEKYYDFTTGDSAVMNRWFPLDSIKIATTDSSQVNGGLLRSWVIPEALFKNNMTAINTLPVRGFLLGKYELEFKIVVQSNPFQACCIMLGLIPNSYGLYPKYQAMRGLLRTTDVKQFSTTWVGEYTYVDMETAIQRPHVILDVSGGGEATLGFSQKYHKTLLRNFDYNFVPSVNPGLRGAHMGALTLHLISDLSVGSANENHFYARIFYRFKQADLTAMSAVVDQSDTPTLQPMSSVAYGKRAEFFKLFTAAQAADTKARDRNRTQETALRARMQEFQTQGPVMSIVGGVRSVVDVADQALHVVEDFGQKSRKGFNAKNRDKPNDCLAMKVVPRPRGNFNAGEGIDDAIVLAVGWTEMTHFFEIFNEEPKSFADFMRLPGLMSRFKWTSAAAVGTSLFTWNVHPTISPDVTLDSLKGNVLRTPLAISSSMFNNYSGTLELFFQFVKTSYHKGAVEVAIHFGRLVEAAGLKSSYVKVLNVQECNGFSVTVPYIYDTPNRVLNGTTLPMAMPGITSDEIYALAHTATVSVKVLNELCAPTTVANNIEVLVWMKAGADYGLTFPRACNSVMSCVTSSRPELLRNPVDARKMLASPNPQPQYVYNVRDGKIDALPGSRDFFTQGDEEHSPDFAQPNYEGNKITTVEHMNFKTLLKMPICILPNFRIPTHGSANNESGRLACFIPVTCVNNTLLEHLQAEYYYQANDVGCLPLVQSIQNQITSMFGMFRGGMVYTIVIKKGSHLHVGYLPHDYKVRGLLSSVNQKLQRFSADNNVSFELLTTDTLGASSFQTTMTNFSCQLVNQSFMVSSVNPSEKYLVPMSTQNNWLLLNRKRANTTDAVTQTMRENSEWLNGHLVLWNTNPDNEDVFVDVYANCADDFELGGFVGHVGVANPFASFALADNWRTQGLDFNLKELTRQGWNSLKDIAIKGGVGIGLGFLASNLAPDVGSVVGALAIYSCVGAVPQILELKQTLEKGSAEITEVVQKVEEINDLGVNMIMKMIVQHFPYAAVQDVGKSLWVITQNIVHSALAQSWKNCSFAMFCILIETRLFTMDDWARLKDHFIEFVSSLVPEKFVTQGVPWESLMEVLVSIVAAKFQISSSHGLKWYFNEIFKWQDYRSVNGLNAIIRLTKSFYQAVAKIINWAVEEADPNVSLIKALQSQDKNLAEFMEDANLYLNNFNDNDFKTKHNRIRFLHTILRAFKLRLVLLKIANPKLTGQLLAMCNKVIDKANKQRYLFKCDLIKSEPFVVGIVGKPNIGKSYSVYRLTSTLLQTINYQSESPDVVFTIPTGVDYWNGYADQPAIWYDDWCNLRDDQTMRAHISQLYALKTSAPFNVPRAELENKEQVASPHLIFLTANDGFPKSPVMTDYEAVYRRRDVLVEFSLKEGTKIGDYTTEQKKNYEHLQVRYYENVCDPGSIANKIYTFKEFEEDLASKFLKFHKNELVNKNEKYKLLMECVRKTKIDSLNLENPFDLIENVVVENEKLLTSDLLMEELERLIQLINDRVELSTHEATDGDVFTTQGGEPKVQVSLVKNLREKVAVWFKTYRSKMYVCENCHESAQKHGTVIWCPEGSHYMCFHCALLSPPIKVPKENEYKEADGSYQSFLCGIHQCPLEIQQKSMASGILAEMIQGKVATLENFYNLVRGLLGQASLPNKVYYSLLICLKLFITGVSGGVWGRIWKQAVNLGYNTQGVEIEEVDEDDFIASLTETEMQYFEERLSLDDYATGCCLPNYETEFNEMPHGSQVKYVCAHSMLTNGYSYSHGRFNVVLVNDEVLEITDEICSKGKCALTNMKFLKQLLRKFEISPEYVDKYQNNDIMVINCYFPKFLRPKEMARHKSRLDKINRLLAKNWWDWYISPVGDWFMQLVKKVCPLIIACGILWGASKVTKFSWTTIKKFFGLDIETEAYDYPNGNPKRSRVGRSRGARNPYSQQSSSENFDNKLGKIASNYIIIKTDTVTMTAWGVSGSTFILPKHLSRRLAEKKKISIEFIMKPHEKLDLLLDTLDIVEMEDQDLALVTVKNSKILFKDCRHFLPLRKDALFDQTKATLMDVDCLLKSVTDVPVRLITTAKNTTAIDPKGNDVFTRNGVIYDYERKGMCGSLVCVDTQYPLLAMHISGSPTMKRGIGVLLYRDWFMHVQSSPEIEDTNEDTTYFGDDVVISYGASIAKDLVPHVPEKTNLMKSLIDNCFDEPSGVMPAILSPKDPIYQHPRSPLFYGVCKNGKPTLDFPYYYRKKAFRMVITRLLAGELIRKPEFLSVQDAVLGLPSQYVDDPYMRTDEDDIYYGALPLDTSSGWPYSTPQYKKKYGMTTSSKSGWIQYERDEQERPVKAIIHEKILQDHEEAMKKRYKGISSVNVFQDCLKDEKRNVVKAMKEGGTRLFSMSNIEGTIALRRATLDFTSYLRVNRLKNGIAVGINKDSLEWTLLAEMLQRVGNNIFTLDFSNFGAGLNYDCGMMFGDALLAYFEKFGSSIDKNVVVALMQELMGSYHVVGNLLYKTYAGSPSGAAITVEMNSFTHLLYAAIAWLTIGDVLAKYHNKASLKWQNLVDPYADLVEYFANKKLPFVEMNMENYMTEVVGVVYGDDGLYSVSDEFKEYFNAVTINLVLKEHRIGVTDATKSETITAYTTLEESSFLKCSFRPNELMPSVLWAAAIEWNTIKECVRWIHRKPLTPDAATRENCESSLLLAWGHGQVAYEEWRLKLNEYLERVNLRPILLTWEDVAMKFYPDLQIEVNM